MHDLTSAFRHFRKQPGFVLTVVLTLALGIGANTAIFTLVHAVLLGSLPVKNPATLYRIGKDNSTSGYGDSMPESGDYSLFSWEQYLYTKANTPAFQQLTAVQSGKETLAARFGTGLAREEGTEYVTGNYFDTLGVQPFAGRLLASSDDRAGAPPAVVISYAGWQADYGGNPHIVGSTVALQGHPATIVGIAPMAFYGDRISSSPPVFWLPMNMEPVIEGGASALRKVTGSWLYFLGRLRPGTRIPALDAQMSADLRHWLMSQPSLLGNGGARLIARQHIWVVPGGGGLRQMQASQSSGLYLLLAISGLVLLVACGNVANLLLARAAAQRAAISLRMALGAARARIVRAMLVESILLACMGGLAGLALAYAGASAILRLAFPDSPMLPIHATPSPTVLGFSFLLSILTGVVFGVVPAWMASHADPAEALRGVNRSTRDRAATPQRVLIVFQAALSLILLVSAGLLTRSLAHLEDRNLGFQTAHRYVVDIDMGGDTYTVAQLPALYNRMEQRFASLPGVAHVGLALYSPMSLEDWSTGVRVTGRRPPPAGSQEDVVDYDRVNPAFFAAVGDPVVHGRNFTAEDTPATQDVAVINQAFARHFFPDHDPVGRAFSTDGKQVRIVGVARDAVFVDPSARSVRPLFFVSLDQPANGLKPGQVDRSTYIHSIVLDYNHPPASVDADARRTLAEVDPALTVVNVRTLGWQVASNYTQNRLLARLAALFGALALVLAAVGLYGILAYQVARRTSEIGIRMALGAQRGSIVGMVLREALVQVAIGLAIGVPIAVLGARAIAAQLYGVSSHDPLSFLAAIAALGVAALVATALPARRAAGVEPVIALRSE